MDLEEPWGLHRPSSCHQSISKTLLVLKLGKYGLPFPNPVNVRTTLIPGKHRDTPSACLRKNRNILCPASTLIQFTFRKIWPFASGCEYIRERDYFMKPAYFKDTIFDRISSLHLAFLLASCDNTIADLALFNVYFLSNKLLSPIAGN